MSQLLPCALATLLSIQGLRKRSLSPSGATAAWLVGFIMMGAPVRAFGVSLIVFYLVGSRATKFGKHRKALLEEGHDEAGTGYRTAWQVFCNSLSAFIATVLWVALFVPGSIPQGILALATPEALSELGIPAGRISYGSGTQWCPLQKDIGNGWSRALLFAALGHFSCCLGDTLASELGILSSSPPILITNFKSVPPGTNGAVSIGGTLASVGGGVIMGATVALTLVLENPVCRYDVLSMVLSLVSLGGVAGGLGSLIDSVMGATIQESRYSVESKRILQDGSRVSGEVKTISGWNVLTNNQVNLVSSTVTALVMAKLS